MDGCVDIGHVSSPLLVFYQLYILLTLFCQDERDSLGSLIWGGIIDEDSSKVGIVLREEGVRIEEILVIFDVVVGGYD